MRQSILFVGGLILFLGLAAWFLNSTRNPATTEGPVGQEGSIDRTGQRQPTPQPPANEQHGSQLQTDPAPQDPEVQINVVATHQNKQPQQDSVEDAVRRLATVKPGEEADRAVAELAARGEVAVGEIERQMIERSPDFGRLHQSVRVLKAINSDRAKSLLSRMALGEFELESRNLEGWAAQALISCDPNATRAMLSSHSANVLNTAMNGLNGQPIDNELMLLLKNCLQHEDRFVQWHAADVMAAGESAGEILEAVGQLLTAVEEVQDAEARESYYLRYISTLINIKTENEQLLQLLEQQQGLARKTVALALAHRGDQSVREEIIELANASEVGLFRAWAAKALGRIGTAADLPLLRTLAEADPLVRKQTRRGAVVPGQTNGNYPVRKAAEQAVQVLENKL